jgi:hypothetical protein
MRTVSKRRKYKPNSAGRRDNTSAAHWKQTMDGEEKGGELPKLGGKSGGKVDYKVFSSKHFLRIRNRWQF